MVGRKELREDVANLKEQKQYIKEEIEKYNRQLYDLRRQVEKEDSIRQMLDIFLQQESNINVYKMAIELVKEVERLEAKKEELQREVAHSCNELLDIYDRIQGAKTPKTESDKFNPAL
jgi:hypothetical protein